MTQSIKELVQSLYADQVATAETLEKKIAAAEEAQALADDAQREVSKARREALNAGWSETQLRKLGLAHGPGKRSRKPRTPKPETGSQDAPAGDPAVEQQPISDSAYTMT